MRRALRFMPALRYGWRQFVGGSGGARPARREGRRLAGRAPHAPCPPPPLGTLGGLRAECSSAPRRPRPAMRLRPNATDGLRGEWTPPRGRTA